MRRSTTEQMPKAPRTTIANATEATTATAFFTVTSSVLAGNQSGRRICWQRVLSSPRPLEPDSGHFYSSTSFRDCRVLRERTYPGDMKKDDVLDLSVLRRASTRRSRPRERPCRPLARTERCLGARVESSKTISSLLDLGPARRQAGRCLLISFSFVRRLAPSGPHRVRHLGRPGWRRVLARSLDADGKPTGLHGPAHEAGLCVHEEAGLAGTHPRNPTYAAGPPPRRLGH